MPGELARLSARRPAPHLINAVRMLRRKARPAFAVTAVFATTPFLAGCQFEVLDPEGPIGVDERSIIILSTCLMLIVVIPVIAMTLAFAWRYRESNTNATFTPDWEHSNRIEAVVWLVPFLIVAVLGYVTWTSTHKLDPYRAIAAAAKPIDVEVISLDWKWLFIYPDLKIASVNELALPVGTPVRFRLTSSSVMDSFFIPELGSQIYTMPGMETKLSLLASKPGTYEGISANYSGDGFSDMHFVARALPRADFDKWVATVRNAPQDLTMAAYHRLAVPSERVPVTYYGDVEPMVYHDVLNKCADGSACTDDAMHLAMAKETFGDVGLCNAAEILQ
ncbi:MAG: ubiquinol oxidase subunit II [Methylovirgula sp.]